jgi:hypothetical protein
VSGTNRPLDRRDLAAAARDSHCTFLALSRDDFKRVVLARVAGIEDQAVNRPARDLNVRFRSVGWQPRSFAYSLISNRDVQSSTVERG